MWLVNKCDFAGLITSLTSSPFKVHQQNMHKQEGIILCLGGKWHLPLEITEPRWQQCGIFVQTLTQYCLRSKDGLWPFYTDSGYKWKPHVPGNLQELYRLEGPFTLKVVADSGLARTRGEMSTMPAKWPGLSAAVRMAMAPPCNAERAELLCSAYNSAHNSDKHDQCHNSNKRDQCSPLKLQSWPRALRRTTLEEAPSNVG